jgi:hypothetical protein
MLMSSPRRTVNDMTMWSHPHRAFRNGNIARHRASGRHAAPADTAGESRRITSPARTRESSARSATKAGEATRGFYKNLT